MSVIFDHRQPNRMDLYNDECVQTSEYLTHKRINIHLCDSHKCTHKHRISNFRLITLSMLIITYYRYCNNSCIHSSTRHSFVCCRSRGAYYEKVVRHLDFVAVVRSDIGSSWIAHIVSNIMHCEIFRNGTDMMWRHSLLPVFFFVALSWQDTTQHIITCFPFSLFTLFSVISVRFCWWKCTNFENTPNTHILHLNMLFICRSLSLALTRSLKWLCVSLILALYHIRDPYMYV